MVPVSEEPSSGDRGQKSTGEENADGWVVDSTLNEVFKRAGAPGERLVILVWV